MKLDHDGDCTIYAAVHTRPYDGICTCGYGLQQLRKNSDDSWMLSEICAGGGSRKTGKEHLNRAKKPVFLSTGVIEAVAPAAWRSLDRDYMFRLFLAGSIEMGTADNWQTRMVKAIRDTGVSTIILNPRREDWDASWVQSVDNPKFREQVEWELDALDQADRALLYFDPNAKSPISLLELGKFCEKMTVCCPEGFWRKGNVDIFCAKYGVEQVASLDLLVADAVKRAKEFAESWPHEIPEE